MVGDLGKFRLYPCSSLTLLRLIRARSIQFCASEIGSIVMAASLLSSFMCFISFFGPKIILFAFYIHPLGCPERQHIWPE
jgi:hypothetical protein